MSKSRSWQFVLLAALAVAVSGCHTTTDLIEELLADNPFDRPTGSLVTKDIVFITCEFQSLELPGQVEVGEFPFWRKFAPDPNGPAQRSWSMRRRWRENGFLIATAPVEQWPLLRESIVAAQGTLRRQGTTTFSRATDIANLTTYRNESTTSILLIGAPEPPHGFTVPVGQCGFRLSCSPRSNHSSDNNVQFRLVPAVTEIGQKQRFVQDEHGPRRINEDIELIFEELAFDGVLQAGHFICIAARPESSGPANLGELFLSRTSGGQSHQQIIVLVPKVQSKTVRVRRRPNTQSTPEQTQR